MGVLGCVRFNEPEELENVLRWMDVNTDGKPYGVDVVMPAKVPTEGTAVDINKMIPQQHRDFVAKTLPTSGCHRCLTMRPEMKVCWAGCIRSPAHMSRWRSSIRSN